MTVLEVRSEDSLVRTVKTVEDRRMVEVFMPFSCLVKCLWPRYREAKVMEPVASLS